jgi:hypothetical protein
VRVHGPLRRLPDGRPALLATVVDHQVAERLTRMGRLPMQQALEDFMRLVVNHSVGGLPLRQLRGCARLCHAAAVWAAWHSACWLYC